MFGLSPKLNTPLGMQSFGYYFDCSIQPRSNLLWVFSCMWRIILYNKCYCTMTVTVTGFHLVVMYQYYIPQENTQLQKKKNWFTKFLDSKSIIVFGNFFFYYCNFDAVYIYLLFFKWRVYANYYYTGFILILKSNKTHKFLNLQKNKKRLIDSLNSSIAKV